MIRKILLSLCFLFVFPVEAKAVYEIESLNANIQILQNTTIRIEETIRVNFLTEHHGIFRNIPEKLRVISVSDPYTVSESTNIKIGDPDVTITGPKVYKIVYEVKDQINQFESHDELYWNVTGSEWEVAILQSSVTVSTEFAEIGRFECFAGPVGSQQRNCDVEGLGATSLIPVGYGDDFTLVVEFLRPNQFQFPSLVERYWWIGLVFLPAIIAAVAWYRRGRDDRYLSDNVYTKPEDGKTQKVSPFDRPHLPNQYYPVQGLTPAEAGTIIDQKVDLADVVAEITELARLKYIEIKPLKKDYAFVRTAKPISNLKAHQILLLNSLTKESYKTEQGYLLSKMKNKFYLDLNRFKESLYTDLSAQKIFDGRPDMVKGGWMVGIFVIQFLLTQFMAVVNPIVLPLGFVSGLVGLFFAYHMPRRSAWGYSLYRQLTGLQYFVGKGKWRYDIAEKRLFLEEILPLAISLGVVSQLTRDMKELELQEPQYMGGVSTRSFGSFQSNLGSTLSSAPSGSRSSGFGGGGSSGGGGGGGGGGGW